jgi:NAD(P)H-dependent FMN reductase
MKKINILALVGGISRDSLNKKLYNAVKERAPGNINLFTFDISKIPFFSQDIENDPPDNIIEFKDLIREADAVLFITPEYNRSFPGVLKNAIDWGSRPYGQNLWDKKPAGVMGATISSVGTFGAQHHLRQVLAYLNLSVMGQPEFYFTSKKSFDEYGNLTDEKTKQFIENYWKAFNEWISQFSTLGVKESNQEFSSEEHSHPH